MDQERPLHWLYRARVDYGWRQAGLRNSFASRGLREIDRPSTCCAGVCQPQEARTADFQLALRELGNDA